MTPGVLLGMTILTILMMREHKSRQEQRRRLTFGFSNFEPLFFMCFVFCAGCIPLLAKKHVVGYNTMTKGA